MARSESQGLQIAVILFTMLTVGLSISTYMYYASYEKAVDARKQAEAGKKSADDNVSSMTARLKTFEYILGKAEVTREQVDTDRAAGKLDAFAETALKDFDNNMKQVAEVNPEGAKSYPTAAINLLPVIEQRGGQTVDLTAEKNLLTTKVQDVEKREVERTKAAEAGFQSKVKDLEGVQAGFAKERDDSVKLLNDLKAQLAAQAAAAKKQKDEDDKAKNVFSEKIGKLEEMLTSANQEITKLRKSGPDFEIPDGEITYINQRERLAWINIGSADGLARQTTFTVYDHDENGVSTTGKSKASIEVIRVLEPHLAECRILKDEIKNPILRGDKIYTPAWSPGTRLHFALNGMLDIDGDGISDNARIRNIILLNGGIIDAEVTNEGKRSGAMTHQTRYLVRGKAPSERELSGDEGKNALAAYGRLLDDAERYGAEVIDATRFLGLMGWKEQERTTNIGEKRVATEQFRERRPGDSATKSSGKAATSAEASGDDEATPIKPKADKPAAEAPAEEDDPFK